MNNTTTNNENGLNDGQQYSLCPEFMKLVHLVMDNEATKEEEQLFLAHIEGSKDCKDHYQEEQNIRSVLKRKCVNAPVPDDLIKAIQQKLQQITIA